MVPVSQLKAEVKAVGASCLGSFGKVALSFCREDGTRENDGDLIERRESIIRELRRRRGFPFG